MSRAAFEGAVRLLGSLSLSELEQLGVRIAALRALSGPVPAPPLVGTGSAATPDAAFPELLYHAASRVLGHELGTRQPPYGTFLLRRRSAGAFARAATTAGAAHAAWFPSATRVETASLSALYASCALLHLHSRRLPVNWTTIATALGNLEEVFDECFPGYARSGLLSLVLTARKRSTAAVQGSQRGFDATDMARQGTSTNAPT